MQTWQYLSGIDTPTREQRVYSQRDDALPHLTISRTEGAHARAVAGHRTFDIRAGGSFLLPRFNLHEGQQPLWRLSVRSPLRNVHRLESASAGLWTIRTPFFNTRVSGMSGAGATLEGCIARFRNEWLFSFHGIQPPDELLVAVAVLHRFSYFHS